MDFLQTWQDYPCNRNKWSEDMYTFFPIWPTSFQRRDRRGHTVVGFTTIYAISAYHLLTLWVRIPLRRGVFDTILCDKVCQLFAVGLWFFSLLVLWFPPPIKLTSITEILLKVALNTITLTPVIPELWGFIPWILVCCKHVAH